VTQQSCRSGNETVPQYFMKSGVENNNRARSSFACRKRWTAPPFPCAIAN
jgi:hypothetical protein